MSIDVATLAAALRGNTKPKSYSLRVPIGSDLDAQMRQSFGNKGSLSWPQQQTRQAYKYKGAGRYSRYPGGTRRRSLRSSGLRLMPRRSRRYGGRGGYWMQKLFGATPGGFWDRAGDAAADFTDAATGGASAMIRGGATALHKQLTGRGMYMGHGAYTQSNSLVDQGAAVPGFSDIPDGNSVTVSHREYIGDIYGPANGNFTNVVYNINPGLERTFPWLSQIACNYDEYTLGQLMFTYRPTVTEFAASSGQQGQVIMATQYNANDAPFTDKRVMMQYDGAMSSKVSCEQIQGVECNPAKLSGDQGKYIRNRPVLSDQDKNTYDHGQFNIAIADIPVTYANQSLGELWVSYTVELRKPKFYANKGLAITKDIFMTNQAKFGTTSTLSQLFGTTTNDRRLLGQQNTMETSIELNSATAPVNTPFGLLRLDVDQAGQEATGINPNIPYAFKITFPAYWAGNVELVLDAICRQSAALFPNPFLFAAQGNITPIRDIMSGEGSGPPNNAWTFGCSSVGGGGATLFPQGATGLGLHHMLHIRVQEASGGIDNAIYVMPGNAGATFADLQVWSAMLTLTEYNVGFNYKPDGTNDAVVLTNVNGNITNAFTA